MDGKVPEFLRKLICTILGLLVFGLTLNAIVQTAPFHLSETHLRVPGWILNSVLLLLPMLPLTVFFLILGVRIKLQ